MSLAYGIGGLLSVPPAPITGNGAPPANFKGKLGQMYIDNSVSPADIYFFNGITWQISTAELDTITTDDSTVVTPVSGNINLAGVAPLATTGAGDTASIELTGVIDVANGGTGAATLTDHGLLVGSGTAAVTALGVATTGQVLLGVTGADPAWTSNPSIAGSVTAGTTLTATLGDITATNGNIVRGTAGNKDVYSSVASTTTAGANSAGTVTLVGGTATIATTAVTASSIIRIYRQGVGATGAAALGILTTANIVAATSFDIRAVEAADATALQASDVSVIAWEIVN